jgi:hypothetical protein
MPALMWVHALPGQGGVDWGYTTDPKQALPLPPYWQKRFASYMRSVGDVATFVPCDGCAFCDREPGRCGKKSGGCCGCSCHLAS